MVQTATGSSEQVREALLDLPSVDEAHVVAGEYDVIVEVGGDEVYDVLHVASSEIQSIDGVDGTKTYIALG